MKTDQKKNLLNDSAKTEVLKVQTSVMLEIELVVVEEGEI
jgi:hypothetical protein